MQLFWVVIGAVCILAVPVKADESFPMRLGFGEKCDLSEPDPVNDPEPLR